MSASHDMGVKPADSRVLARIEAMSREELLALQFAKLKRQLERVYATNAFYRARFQAVGVTPDNIRSLDDFRERIPVVTKADCLADQQAHPPFGSRLGLPREEVVLVTLTGGTSGQGQEVYGRCNADVALQAHQHYVAWFMSGLRRGDVVFNCVPTGGLTTGGWGPPDGLRIGGTTAFNVGGVLGTDAKIDLMCRFGEVHFIYASTNYLHTLTEGLRRRGISPRERFPMIKGLYVAAEGYSPKWALAIEEFWGCRLHEGYGSTQGAGWTYTSCPDAPLSAQGERRLHALEWFNLSEVVDPDTGRPVGPGEEGEIVLTNLDIRGSPVIRFSTRDKARWFPHDACGCGRPWHCIQAGSIGRYDDMMKIRGNNVWPVTVDAAVFAYREVAEYVGRVGVDEQGRTEASIRLAWKSDFAGAPAEARGELMKQIAAQIKASTNVQMTLVEVPRSELPIFDYKARRWIDERQKGYNRQADPGSSRTSDA